MSTRILFVASLHHPETLAHDQASARAAGTTVPLFPTTNSYHFYEKELQRQGYEMAVFWRNLSPRARNNPAAAVAERFKEGLTLRKVLRGLNNRVPPTLSPDLRARNAYLLRYAEAFQPQVVWVVGDNRVIYADTLAELKRRHGCTIVYASGTSPIVFSQPMERQAARLYDWVLVNDFYHGIQWQELGSRQMLCLPIAAADPDFHARRVLSAEEQTRLACDISFVGTLVPQTLYSERVAALAALRDFDLGIWSVHDVPADLRPALRGSALGDEMMRVLSASRLTVNPHGDFMRYGGNMRLFEAAALGVFQLVDDRPGIQAWFEVGQQIITYRDVDDLRAKAAYYLAHDAEREQVAAAARAHVLAHHTYAQRVATLQQQGIL